MKQQTKTLTRKVHDKYEPISGWSFKEERFEVVVMAVVGRYAMVRRKGCTPFVCEAKKLSDV